jgi:hypothetical protein
MLAADKEVAMGFLDKLLGRGKDAAETTGDTAKDMGGKAGDVADDVGQKAEDMFDETKARVTGDDEPREPTP